MLLTEIAGRTQMMERQRSRLKQLLDYLNRNERTLEIARGSCLWKRFWTCRKIAYGVNKQNSSACSYTWHCKYSVFNALKSCLHEAALLTLLIYLITLFCNLFFSPTTSNAFVLKSGSLNLLEPSGPVKVCNGIALSLPLMHTSNASENFQSTYFSKYVFKELHYTVIFSQFSA
jgi:hypothetical protein